MKKITFLVVALCAAIFVNAASVTLTMKDYAAASFTSAGGVSVTTAVGSGVTPPAYNATAFDLRVYANGTIVITSPEAMTRISFGISPKGEFRLAPVAASVGSVVVKGDPDFTAVWTGNAKTVTFTVGAQADYGKDGSAKAGQLCFTTLDIVTNGEGGGTDPIDPDPTSDFEMAEAEMVYYPSYSSAEGYNFATSLFSDMTWGADAETGYSIPTSEGNYFSLDMYAVTATSFVGTYTFDASDSYVAGTFGAEYSVWVNVSATGVETELALTAGTITITNNGAGYTFNYSLTDANSIVHTGNYAFGTEVVGIYDEEGNDYSGSINDEPGEDPGEDPVTYFEMFEADVTYFDSYSSASGYNFFIALYSDMTWEENTETGYLVPTSEGSEILLDLYAATATSFVGTYTFDALDTSLAGTFSAGYSAWVNVNTAGVETQVNLTGGTVTVAANGGGVYTITYSLTDINSVVHNGSLTYSPAIVDENDIDYSGSINDDGTAISHVEASLEVYTRGGNIVVPAEAGQRIVIYNMMGQTIYNGIAQGGETTITGLSNNHVLMVRAGNKTAKVVL